MGGRPTEAKPLMIGEWADIGVWREGDDYYLAHSSGMWRPAALIWHSRDLRRWRPLTHAVRNHTGCVWLTDLVRDGDLYRVFWLSHFGEGGGWTASAPDMAGPWSEPEPTGLPPDLVLGRDEQGVRYAFTGRGYVQRLEGDGLSAAEPPRKAYDGWPIPEDWAVEMSPCLEAPKILHRDGWWYLVEAEGGTFGPSTSHMVVAARARSPHGPWENSPYNPVIRTWSRAERWWSKGHGQLVEGPAGHWYCIMHGIPRDYRSIGRCTLIEPVEWTDDGWFRAAAEWPPGWEGGASAEMELTDDFTDPDLGLHWQFWGRFDPSRFSVGGGALDLQGRGDGPGDSEPLSVQPMHYAYEVETELEIRGGACAGLMLFGKPDCYIGLELGADGVLRKVQQGYRRYEWATDPDLGVRRVALKIVNAHQDARFYYRMEGSGWRIVQPSMEVSFGASLWVNLRPALFCHGEGACSFRGFRYTVLSNRSL